MRLFRKKKKIDIDDMFILKMKEIEEKRDIITSKQRPDSIDYGYSYENPICSGSIGLSEMFLNDLKTIDGKDIAWNRTGSISLKECNGLNDIIIDEYSVFINNRPYVSLYICPYGHGPFYLPFGFLSKTDNYKSKNFSKDNYELFIKSKEKFINDLNSFNIENENEFLNLLSRHKIVTLINNKIVLTTKQMNSYINILFEQIKFFEACVLSIFDNQPQIFANSFLFDAFEIIEPFSSEKLESVNLNTEVINNRIYHYYDAYKKGIKPIIAEEFKQEISEPLFNFQYSQKANYYAKLFIDFMNVQGLDLDTSIKMAEMEKVNLSLAKEYDSKKFNDRISFNKDLLRYALETYTQIQNLFSDNINKFAEKMN